MNIFNGDENTKYTSFGSCDQGVLKQECGEKTGFYLTLVRGSSVLTSFRFRTANSDVYRDPLNVTIEGSNKSPSNLDSGSV